MSRFESAFQRLKLDSFFMPGHIREQCEVGAMLTVGVARADPAFRCPAFAPSSHRNQFPSLGLYVSHDMR